MVELVRADPRYRRRALALLVALAACAAVALLLLPGALSSHAPSTSGSALVVLVAALVVACSSVATIGISIFRRGRRVLRGSRFPVPGERVVRDTLVLSGETAVKRGRVLEVLGVTLFLLAVALSVVSWRLYVLFSARAA